MKTTKRYATLVLMILFTMNASAQLKETMKNIFLGDTTIIPTTDIPKKDSDSIKLSLMQKMLDEMRLSEADTRMEMELMKLQLVGVDSAKIAVQQHRIDSLKQFTKGVPVVVEKDTLFYLYTKRGGIMPKQRAQITGAAIEKLGKRFNLTPDSVYIDTSDIVSDVMYDNKVLVSFTDQDALWAGISRDSLANEKRDIIVSKLFQLKAEHSLWKMIERIIYLILVIVGQVILFRLTNWLFRKAKLRIIHLKFTKKLKPIFFHDYELLDTRKQVSLLVFLAGTTRYMLMALQLLITVPLIFIIFPQTEGLAFKLLEYIWNPIESILIGVVEYIPKLFTIIVIWYAVKSLVRLFHYLSKEVENGRLKIRGFFPDWALPTYHIIRFLLYAFMIAMIYPYLPGSKSGVFQGISVFVGIIVSLGSSTVIGNIIAGMVITYMRPFKIGDRIKLNDTEGKLIEKTPLVARIRTSKNEIVTVPNSFIMSSHTVNFSTSALESGLIIHTEVAMGYEVPWKQVKKILIQAARNTPGVLEDPAPFVLQTSLDDWYPIYQINAYIKDVDQMAPIYSDLFQNIQDGFMDAGIEMLSPHYMAIRDGNASTLPKDNMKADGAKKSQRAKKSEEAGKSQEDKKPQKSKKAKVTKSPSKSKEEQKD